MAKKNVIVPGTQVAHIKPFENVFRDRVVELPLDKVMIYLIDTVDAKALPFLAEQFNVLGNRGWRFAIGEARQRELLKKAIYLQRIEGTEAAILEALKIIGIENATILHPIPGNTYNGQWSHNGSITYGGAYHWAAFKVLVNYLDLVELPPDTLEIAVELINEWKNVRSFLVGVEAMAELEDVVEITDEFEIDIAYEFNEQLGPNLYDGTITYNGSATHSGNYDEFEIETTVDTFNLFEARGAAGAGKTITVSLQFNDPGVSISTRLPDGSFDNRLAGTSESIGYTFTGSESLGMLVKVSDLNGVNKIIIDGSFIEVLEFLNAAVISGVTVNGTNMNSVLGIANIVTPEFIEIDLTNNKLTSSAVNTILANIVADPGFEPNGSVLYIDGQTPPAPPTGAGITNAVTVSAAWDLQTD